MGPKGPLGACRLSTQEQREPQRPHQEPKRFHRDPILGPTESYGAEHSSSFLIFCEVLFCLILMFSFITFSFLTQNQRSWTFFNREWNGPKENKWYL